MAFLLHELLIFFCILFSRYLIIPLFSNHLLHLIISVIDKHGVGVWRCFLYCLSEYILPFLAYWFRDRLIDTIGHGEQHLELQPHLF